MSGADNPLRLLVPRKPAPPGRQSVAHGAHSWILEESVGTNQGRDAPAYTCVSYAWGAGSVSHPFDSRHSMSDRTLAVMETVAGLEVPQSLWVDAFCVPLEEPGRSACLREMGRTYSRASQVVVVLSAGCTGVLERIRARQPIDEATLLTLERDDWVSRVWTYQELVNSGRVRFVAEGSSSSWADAEEILHDVLTAIHEYTKARGYDSFQLKAAHPRLDGLEELIVDWKIAGYEERSAYQVMSRMHGRDAERPEDHFYAMIGAITAAPAEAISDTPAHPAAQFMEICEAKGDFSFIYTNGARSSAPGRSWRPAMADRFPAVFSWHSWGAGQSGKLYPTHLELNGICRLERGCIGETVSLLPALRAILDDAVGDPATQILERLRLAGFSGCGEYLETPSGFFFVQEPLPRGEPVFAAVTSEVRTSLGAPGLLLRETGCRLHPCCGVGLFVGEVPKTGNVLAVG